MARNKLPLPALTKDDIQSQRKQYLTDLVTIVHEYETLWLTLKREIKACESIMERQNKLSKDLWLKHLDTEILTIIGEIKKTNKSHLREEVKQMHIYLEREEKDVHAAFSVLQGLSTKFSENMKVARVVITKYFIEPESDDLEPVRKFLDAHKANRGDRVKPFGISNYPEVQQLEKSWESFDNFYKGWYTKTKKYFLSGGALY